MGAQLVQFSLYEWGCEGQRPRCASLFVVGQVFGSLGSA